ncbi:MAG: carcinine hydrolase/isopenicillin-N N-acyltransferase family protein, partial [Aquihabitans sp.]
QTSREAAVALLDAVPHASGQNYLIADRRGATDLECGHGFVRTLDGTDGRLAHTNHVLGKSAPGEPGVVADSEERLAALLDRIGNGTGIDVTAAAAILRAPPTYRNERGEATTFSSTIADLSDPPVLHIADGPPGNEFTAHSVAR